MRKDNEKKKPKTSKDNYILSSDAEAVLYGLILTLLSLIGILNVGPVGEALTYIFSYLFGVFYVFFYLLIAFFGLYLMIKKQMYRLKVDLKIFGGVLLLLGFCIAASMGNGLTLQNFFTNYQYQVTNTQKYIFAMVSTNAIYENLGGGLIGYFLTAAFNSSINEVGTAIVVFTFILIGMILLFKDVVVKFVKWIISYHKRRKEVRNASHIEEKKQPLKPEEEVKEEIKKEVPEYKEVKKLDFETFVSPKRMPASTILKSLDEDEEKNTIKDDEIVIKKEEIVEPVKDEKKQTELTALELLRQMSEEDKIEEKKKKEENVTPIKEVLPPIDAYQKKEEVVQPTTQKKNLYLDYKYPSIDLLKDRFNADETERKNQLAKEKMDKINECFVDLGIGASVISYTIGPSVTRFDVKVNAHVRTNVLSSIENDLAVRLGGNKTVRLETIVEGKNTSGIEVGNDICDTVSFKECMKSPEMSKKSALLFPLGKNISGDIITCSLDEMPHLLVCGTTGSGKSVFIHNIICSLIMRNKPDELKLMLVDPKRIEFTKYNDLPHLLCPVITSTDRGKVGLMKLVEEMERRYDLFAEKGRGASNYKEYLEVCEEMGYEKIPYIVMICDEFADFMSDGDKEVAKLIQRIAQKARACGIHMVIATQRPSVKVITGDIKANIPSRIALSVSSQMDSRIIIDEPGAENLMGKGDLLARIPSHKSLLRVQSAFIDSKEIFSICEHIKSQAEFICDPNFEDLTLKVVSPFGSVSDTSMGTKDFHNDARYEEIKKFVIATGKCSSTKIQNTFGIGYPRADGILDTLEADGIIIRENGRRVVAKQYGIYQEDGEDKDEL